jgi:hypothetical protein
MDPVEQFIASDSGHMLGTDHEATVHCRSGGLRLSTSAGSRSMKTFEAFHSPQSLGSSLPQVVRLEHNWRSLTGRTCSSIPSGNDAENGGVSSSLHPDNHSEGIPEAVPLNLWRSKTRNHIKANPRPTNRMRFYTESCTSSSGSWSYCNSSHHISLVNQSSATDYHASMRRHKPLDSFYIQILQEEQLP